MTIYSVVRTFSYDRKLRSNIISSLIGICYIMKRSRKIALITIPVVLVVGLLVGSLIFLSQSAVSLKIAQRSPETESCPAFANRPDPCR